MTRSVRDYYEHNTRRFLFFNTEATIHRGLWGPGVQTPEQAAHWVHGELLTLLAARWGDREVRWLDLGCGVGTTCRWLAARRAGTGLGLTISETQAALATQSTLREATLREATLREATLREGLGDRCRFLTADFCAMPGDLGSFELVYAIESYIHATDPGALFASVAKQLAPDGVFALIDDMLAPDADPNDPVVVRFRRDWHATALSTVHDLCALAAASGLTLVEDRDLTPLVRLWRPRDRLIRWLQPIFRAGASYNPWFQSLVGGDALQQGLHTGTLHHRWLLFRLS